MKKEESDLRDRTKAFALRVIKLFAALPKATEAQVIGKQVLRSGTSVGANYREAYRARSKAEFRAKCGDSLKELEEIVGRLETGDMPLEESLELFEKGIRLSRDCQKRLDEADCKIEILLKGNDGTLVSKPFHEPQE